MYDCFVGPGVPRWLCAAGGEARGLALLPGSTAPTMLVVRKAACIVWGAKAKPSAPAYQPPGGFAVNARVWRAVRSTLSPNGSHPTGPISPWVPSNGSHGVTVPSLAAINPICTKPPQRGCMIAGPDRASPSLASASGTKVLPLLCALRFDSPDDAVSPRKAALFRALRQGRRFLLIFPAALL